MSLVSPAEFRTHYETDLPDEAVQLLLDAEDSEIVRRAGPHSGANVTQTFYPAPGQDFLYLPQVASAISTVVEDGSTLVSTDFALHHGGVLLERANASWRTPVEVTYTPLAEVERRKKVLVELGKLAINYNALRSESVGDYSATSVDYIQEREMILSQLTGSYLFA